jgi:hypothetical protein
MAPSPTFSGLLLLLPAAAAAAVPAHSASGGTGAAAAAVVMEVTARRGLQGSSSQLDPDCLAALTASSKDPAGHRCMAFCMDEVQARYEAGGYVDSSGSLAAMWSLGADPINRPLVMQNEPENTPQTSDVDQWDAHNNGGKRTKCVECIQRLRQCEGDKKDSREQRNFANGDASKDGWIKLDISAEDFGCRGKMRWGKTARAPKNLTLIMDGLCYPAICSSQDIDNMFKYEITKSAARCACRCWAVAPTPQRPAGADLHSTPTD